MAKKFIIGNWKENPQDEKQALALFRGVAKMKEKDVEAGVCPPFIFLECVSAERKRLRAKKIGLGAQDVFWEEGGAYTGEIGPRMLKRMGMKYAIIGHSERREWLGETDLMVNKKVKLALKDGLTVIVCVGEALKVRDRGMGAAKKFVAGQLANDLRGLAPKDRKKLFVAYEPVWAIGTGRYDPAEDAAAMAEHIKKIASRGNPKAAPRVLYGGSVNSRNIADYVQCRYIDGALVGGASLSAAEFRKIVKAAGKRK